MYFVVTGKEIPTAAVTKDIDAAFHLSESLQQKGLNVYVNCIEEEYYASRIAIRKTVDD